MDYTEPVSYTHLGSFDVVLDDGKNKCGFPLNRSYKGLYVTKGIWRRMTNFSTNSLALVLSSTDYNVNDYVISSTCLSVNDKFSNI